MECKLTRCNPILRLAWDIITQRYLTVLTKTYYGAQSLTNTRGVSQWPSDMDRTKLYDKKYYDLGSGLWTELGVLVIQMKVGTVITQLTKLIVSICSFSATSAHILL